MGRRRPCLSEPCCSPRELRTEAICPDGACGKAAPRAALAGSRSRRAASQAAAPEREVRRKVAARAGPIAVAGLGSTQRPPTARSAPKLPSIGAHRSSGAALQRLQELLLLQVLLLERLQHLRDAIVPTLRSRSFTLSRRLAPRSSTATPSSAAPARPTAATAAAAHVRRRMVGGDEVGGGGDA